MQTHTQKNAEQQQGTKPTVEYSIQTAVNVHKYKCITPLFT